MKKIIFIVLIIMFPILLLIILDFLNITSLLPFTDKYDWLAFFGTYIAGVCTLILGIVSIKQNGSLSDLNKQMLRNNMITTRFSKIELEHRQFFDLNIRDDYNNIYGYKMKPDEIINDDDLFYTRFILHIKDINDLPLMYGRLDKLEVYYGYERAYQNEKNRVYISNAEEIKLEVTPFDDHISYYLPICLIDKKSELYSICDSKKIRLVATICIKNSFGVVSQANYTMHLSKLSKASEDWTEYRMDGRKIYYKEIIYEGETNL